MPFINSCKDFGISVDTEFKFNGPIKKEFWNVGILTKLDALLFWRVAILIILQYRITLFLLYDNMHIIKNAYFHQGPHLIITFNLIIIIRIIK